MIIDVEALGYTYHGANHPALRGLTFQVARGEIFGFLGPSGVGKSTTQRILTALLPDFEGQATVLGRDLRRWQPDDYEQIGVSFELPNHFTRLTARENLAYFATLYQRPTRDPLRLLTLVSLDGDADTPVEQYSKGMKNRLTVARALLHDPALLFLDEPTAGLDPANARCMTALIRGQQQAGKSVFLTTHDMGVATALCDRVAFLVDGEIKLIAAPRELRLRYGRPSVRVDYLANGILDSREFPLSGLGHNEAYLELLRRHMVETMHTQEATLDDIFMEVTGKELAS
jgi:fluoroquinolone transport system ATP-binding protein